MMKDANIQKALLSASARFWMSLLVSSVVVNSLPLQARADQVAGKDAIAPVSQASPSTVSAIDQAPTSTELTSDKKDINSKSDQDTESALPQTTWEPKPVESSTELPTLDDVPSVSDLSDGEGATESNNSMSQITNVTQLRDVSRGDWAFEGLRSLVERYGCIAGYSDGTFRGNRSSSRYEFAAGLN